MNYTVTNSNAFPMVEITLAFGEEVQIESGCMVYHKGGVTLEGKMNSNQGGLGGFVKALGRSMVSGESFFITKAKSQADGSKIAIAPSVPGMIRELEIGEKQWRIRDQAFLACDSGVSYEMKRQSFGKAFFGGTGGFFIMETRGSGCMLVNSYGDLREVQMDGSRSIVVDNTHVVAWSTSLNYEIKVASGTFGYGQEYADFMDLSRIGGIFVKGTTIRERQGNDYPRMAETPSGMLNAVGLQNKGVDYFISNIYPEIKDIDTNIIVNVSGSTIEDYVECSQRLADLDKVPAIELNISCPNVKEGGMAFGTSACSASEVTKAVREVWKKTLIVKLSPNVTDITEIAKAVEGEGADAVSLINTLLGMAIDINKRRPVLSTVTGGLSGPCVKPVALRMVWQTYNAVKIPVIGMGGISLLSLSL